MPDSMSLRGKMNYKSKKKMPSVKCNTSMTMMKVKSKKAK